MAKSDTKLGPVDLSSDVPPGRGIKWQRVVLSWVSVDLSSDVLTGRGIKWPGAVLWQVSLTFGQPLGQADL